MDGWMALCIAAALKGVLGGELLSGDLKLHEMDLLSKMCPLALLQIGLASILTGEVSAIIGRWDDIMSSSAPQVVMLSGVLSFTLNVSSLVANKVTSPLTLAIAANIKQVSLYSDRSIDCLVVVVVALIVVVLVIVFYCIVFYCFLLFFIVFYCILLYFY
jgi:hypothetical protein